MWWWPGVRLDGVVHAHGAAPSFLIDVPSSLSSPLTTPTSSVMFAVTMKPGITVAPFDGDVIMTTGGWVSGVLEPNSAVIIVTSFWVAAPVPAHVWVAWPPEPVHVRPNGDWPPWQ